MKKGEINMAKKEERFEVTFRDGSQLKDEGVRQILVDKETGVNYLCWKSGYGAAITPLLDSGGKVIVLSLAVPPVLKYVSDSPDIFFRIGSNKYMYALKGCFDTLSISDFCFIGFHRQLDPFNSSLLTEMFF